MNIIFQIEGGLGKSIMATAVCKAIHKNFPNDDLIVVTAYPEVFINNPNVKTTLQIGNANYFYRDYIEGKEVKLMMHNPYLEASHVKEEKHLIETWCEMFGVEYGGEIPEIFLNNREIEFYQKKYQSDKPIFMMQTNGGAPSELKYSFARDIPSCVVSEIIEHFSPNYNIVHVKREDQIGYANTNPILAGYREVFALSLMSSKRLLMDSFLQHACAALNLPSTVCWITNSPEVFGYSCHDNILANPQTVTPELKYSYIQKFSITGEPIQFPYRNEAEIFDAKKIIESLEFELHKPV